MILSFVMLNPGFAAAGLVAVGIATWMHLYMRVSGKRMTVSSLRLVPQTPQVARSRKRIQYWPLFLLRALGVLLLGLAFARPGLPGGAQDSGTGREALALVLDRSGSMAMKSAENISAWEDAKRHVEKRLLSMHPESRVRLFCFPPAETGTEWASPSAVRKIVGELLPSLAEGQPLDAVTAAAEALARFRSDMPESLEIVGDMQESGWERTDTLTLPAELRVTVVQAGNPNARNRSLSLQVRGNGQLRRGAVVRRGDGVAMNVRDQNGKDGDVSERDFPLPGKVLELPYQSTENGWVQREVSFRDADDGLAEDNTLYDTFYVAPMIDVYLIEPNPGRKTFLQTTFFLQQALRPSVGEAAEDSRFAPRVIPVLDAVAALSGAAGKNAVVVIPPIENWPSDLPDTVEAFVRKGGGAVFFTGAEIEPTSYASAWSNLLPAMPGTPLNLDRSLALPFISETHPIWGGLDETLRYNLRRAPMQTRSALTLAEGVKVTATYIDDVPLVVQRTLGDGRTLFVNTSADRAWSDLPANGILFVPTVHMFMSAAVASASQALRDSPGGGIVGVPFDVRVGADWAGARLKTGGRKITADDKGRVRGLVFEKPGLFDLESADGRFVRPVAVNFPPGESVREFQLPTILQRKLEARRRTTGADGDPPRISLASESGLWKWVVGALLIVWMGEPLLALRTTSSKGLKA
ncbi:MAG: BatA domain-containing protein [Akkermansiaceae bacterium]